MSAIGKTYRYCARIGHVTGRHGQLVVVRKWHRSKVLVRFPDGWEAIVPGRCLKKIKRRNNDD